MEAFLVCGYSWVPQVFSDNIYQQQIQKERGSSTLCVKYSSQKQIQKLGRNMKHEIYAAALWPSFSWTNFGRIKSTHTHISESFTRLALLVRGRDLFVKYNFLWGKAKHLNVKRYQGDCANCQFQLFCRYYCNLFMRWECIKEQEDPICELSLYRFFPIKNPIVKSKRTHY